MLRVRLDAYRTAHGRLRARSLVLLVFGALGVVISSFGALLGLLILVMEEGGLWEARSGAVIGLFGCLFLAGSVIMIWRGALGRGRMKRIGELAALARSKPDFSGDDLARAMDVSRHAAERVIVEAAALGVVEETLDAGPPAVVGAGSDPLARTVPVATLAAAPASLVGTVLGGTYRVERHIGSGGMGAVYEARHLRTSRRYAVKTLLFGAQATPDAIRRFEREAMAASALGHPGIVAVHDFHETPDGVHYLVMDLLEGETLEQRLERGRVPWQAARAIGLELAAALAAAHQQGLLHRDLKPGNVFIARSGSTERAVLLDFGLAKRIDDAAVSRITTTGAAVGTPLYMSPEQARGEPVDVRTDVYGLCAVVYEMVTGAPPFMDATLAKVYARLLQEPAPAASSMAPNACPPALDAILARGLAKSPAERFPDVAALAAALASVVG